MILYRPVSLQEIELIYDGGMKEFPTQLPQQPIFYPVLQIEYARQIASDWNTKSGQSAGYVTQFKVEDEYISQFEEHSVGESQYQELWIPADELEEFNKHLNGHIKVVEAYFGKGFQGFVPNDFGLKEKNAIEQFTLLSNSYIYKRMDFYLEIKRNHKAIFLNYPFWHTYSFKNPGLKEQILKAIKEAWLTSFPKTPLANPVEEETLLEKEPDSRSSVKRNDEEVTPHKQIVSHPLLEGPKQSDSAPPEKTVSDSDEDSNWIEEAEPEPEVVPIPTHSNFAKKLESNIEQGVRSGLDGNYQEAIHLFSKVAEATPNHVLLQTSMGVAFQKLGEYDRAFSCYEAALKINHKYAEAHYFKANILYTRGHIREAIAEYTTAMGLQPELIEAYQKSIPQDRLTEYSPIPAQIRRIATPAQRILELNKMLDANPKQAHVLKERAAEYSRLGNYEQTVADYSSALAIHADDVNALHSRGAAYEQMGQFDHAQQDFQHAYAINPQLSDMHIHRGIAFAQMGNFRQSITSLTEGIRLAPQNPDGYFNRGMAHFQQGDFESAVSDFSKVIQLSPNDEAAYYWRAVSHEEAGRKLDAVNDYKQFLQRSQDPHAIQEIEQKLAAWQEEEQENSNGPRVVPSAQPTIHQTESENIARTIDLYELIAALDEKVQLSTWLCNNVECYGEGANELFSFADQNLPIAGSDFLRITSGIEQTVKGDFLAFAPGSPSHWMFIRAWDGNGFYIEINDPKNKRLLKTHFQSEDVEEVEPPYEGLFIPL